MAKQPVKPGSWGDWAIIEHKPKAIKSCEACIHYCQDGSCGKHPSIVIKDVGFNFYKLCKDYITKDQTVCVSPNVKASPGCCYSAYVISMNCFICRNSLSPHYSNQCKQCAYFVPLHKRHLAEKTKAFSNLSYREYRQPSSRTMCDIHSHILFGMDDGAVDLSMSLELLRLSARQGITDVVCTSHSWGKIENYALNFEKLKKAAKAEGLAIHIYPGCEIQCADWKLPHVVKKIKSGDLPTINHSNYVLLEFDTHASADEILHCSKAVHNLTGMNCILAHFERYRHLQNDMDTVDALQKAGCLFQINAYSLVEEARNETREFARKLLAEKRVTFLGSDAHRSNHRAPAVRSGIQYVYETCDSEYSQDVCKRNAQYFLFLK